MEMILWLLFAAVVVWCLLNPLTIIAKLTGGTKHRAKGLPKASSAPLQDFTDWQRYAAEGRQRKAADHEAWLDEAWTILRRHCEHVYHHQKWYTCMKCGYEEPWVWQENCGCTVQADQELTDPTERYSLITRQSWCSVHGIDFKLYPLSDRKKGPFGSGGAGVDTRAAVVRSKELFPYQVTKKINFPTK